MLSYAHGVGEEPLLGETIGANLERTIARVPDADALVSVHQDIRYTYAEFGEAVDRRECDRILRAARGGHDTGHTRDAETILDDHARPAGQELLTAERHAALLEAFAHRPPCCRQLTGLFIEDPPVSYAEISARLGITVRSIRPDRRRCLDKLRRDPALAVLINAGTGTRA